MDEIHLTREQKEVVEGCSFPIYIIPEGHQMGSAPRSLPSRYTRLVSAWMEVASESPHGVCSGASLAEALGVHEKTVRRQVKHLAEKGWVVQQTIRVGSTRGSISMLSPPEKSKSVPEPRNLPTDRALQLAAQLPSPTFIVPADLQQLTMQDYATALDDAPQNQIQLLRAWISSAAESPDGVTSVRDIGTILARTRPALTKAAKGLVERGVARKDEIQGRVGRPPVTYILQPPSSASPVTQSNLPLTSNDSDEITPSAGYLLSLSRRGPLKSDRMLVATLAPAFPLGNRSMTYHQRRIWTRTSYLDVEVGGEGSVIPRAADVRALALIQSAALQSPSRQKLTHTLEADATEEDQRLALDQISAADGQGYFVSLYHLCVGLNIDPTSAARQALFQRILRFQVPIRVVQDEAGLIDRHAMEVGARFTLVPTIQWAGPKFGNSTPYDHIYLTLNQSFLPEDRGQQLSLHREAIVHLQAQDESGWLAYLFARREVRHEWRQPVAFRPEDFSRMAYGTNPDARLRGPKPRRKSLSLAEKLVDRFGINARPVSRVDDIETVPVMPNGKRFRAKLPGYFFDVDLREQVVVWQADPGDWIVGGKSPFERT